MRFKRHIELEHGLKQIDIAPLIDVVFLLLIFFMLTSSFVVQPGIRLSLPRAVTSGAIEPQNAEILVTAENNTYLDGQPATLDQIKSFFRQAAKRDQTILVKADSRASVGRVVEIWDAARDMGITRINIATNRQ